MRYLLPLLLVTVGCSSNPLSPSAPSAPPVVQQAQTPTPAPIQTWIISGQSNAVGCATVGDVPATSPAVTMWAGSHWVTAVDPLVFMEQEPHCRIGAWVTAASDYTSRTGQPVRLTGWGRLGAAESLWDEGGEGWQHLRANIPAPNGAPSVFVWFQGETEAYALQTADYGSRLTDLIARVRGLNPETFVIVIGLADAPASALYNAYADVRRQQLSVVVSDSHARYVTAEGLERRSDEPYHLSAAGYAELGHRVAAVIPEFHP